MFNEKNFFDQPVKNDLRTCDNIQMIDNIQRNPKIYFALLQYQYKMIKFNTLTAKLFKSELRKLK